MSTPDSSLQSRRFLLLYALAAAGGAAAYVPFLSILLPLKAAGMAGNQGVQLLAYTAFAGAICASIANIFFGWLSDITQNRRGWIVAGLVSSSVLLLLTQFAQSASLLIAIICLWQCALNMMLGPLAAWAGDVVPDAQKGFLGGLLSLSPAAGAWVGAFITIPELADAGARLELVVLIVAALVLPAILLGRPRHMVQLVTPVVVQDEADRPYLKTRPAIARMWLARLLVQIAEVALFAYLLFWFQTIETGFSDNDVALLLGAVMIAGVPLALLVGHWSDARSRPIMPLACGAAGIAAGLLIMAGATSLVQAVAGYIVFGLASSVFLALHSGQTLRVLPRPQHRGRDLGVFNLTNTVPSLVMPVLAISLVPVFGFAGLFATLALFAIASAILLATLVIRN